MVERFCFADSFTGLEHAIGITLSLRHNGYKTRLVTTPIKLGAGFHSVMHIVEAQTPVRPNRMDRGCNIIPRRKT
jgi:hypothetical protein